MRAWKTRSRETILDEGKFLRVENHVVELPDGTVIDRWSWVITPDFANVLAETEDGRFICFRQTKYAVAGVSLAPAGGYLEPAEDPLVAAQRELREETGYAATEWVGFGSYPIDGNRGSGVGHLFLARGAYPAAAPVVDDLEEQEMLLLSRAELAAALHRGEFKVLPWTTLAALTLLHVAGEQPPS